MRVHELKIWPAHFRFVETGEKTCEIRKRDRDYRLGDTLWLKEYDPASAKYSGEEVFVLITHILGADNSKGVAPGHVALSVRLIPKPNITEIVPPYAS